MAEKLGYIQSSGSPFPKPDQSWLEKATYAQGTHSVKAGGGSLRLEHPKKLFPKGLHVYELTFRPQSPYWIHALFWIFDDCEADFDDGFFGLFEPGCACYKTVYPKLSITLWTHSTSGPVKDTRVIQLHDAPTKSQYINKTIGTGSCKNAKGNSNL